MPAITANDVTVSYNRKVDEVQVGEYYDAMPTISFGNGSLTYPTNGVPLPIIGKLGPFRRGIKRFLIEQPLNGYVYAYDATNHTIRIFQAPGTPPGPLTEVTTSHAPAATTLRVIIRGN